MNNKREVDSESPIKFVKTRGSKVAGRYKEKRERIHEAVCDLGKLSNGLIAQLGQSDQFGSVIAVHCGSCSRLFHWSAEKWSLETGVIQKLDCSMMRFLNL